VSARGSRLTRGWEQGFRPGPERVLAAAGGAYRGLVGAREWLYARGVLKSRSVGCPVVAIGNLTVGGTGKTPAVEVAVQTLTALGHRPAVVSRGYGRRTSGIHVVADAASIRLDAEEAGDEPFLLARRLPGVPVVVGGNRYATARLAVERFGVTAIVLDDAFQHRTLTKDLEVVMALASLTALVVAAECWEASRMRPVGLAELAGARVLAFAGIAAPDAFATTLEASGVDLARLVPFPDHHWYTGEELARLDDRAGELGAAGLITTEKDWVRLRKLPLPRRPLWVLAIRLVLTSGEDAWQAAFKRACSRG
jgi:tetraacyldisaccharide 4'-kinase